VECDFGASFCQRGVMAHRWRFWSATAAPAAVCYTVLWVAFARHLQWLNAIDSAMLDPLHAYGVKHPGWLRFWDVLCTVLGPEAFRLVGVGVAVVVALRRNARAVLFVLTTIELSGVVSQVAKNLAGRPRPAGALAGSVSSAFPSGHAVGAMTGVLALLTITAGMFTRRGRIAAIAIGAVAVIAVGLGRVVLNVHYPSDVVAGWALGYLWYLGCLLVIRPLPLTEAARPDPGRVGAATDETREAPGAEP
jgi:membrane-associated phospholipid phosphatase